MNLSFTSFSWSVFHPLYLPLFSSWRISCRDCGKLRLIYGSRCVVSPIGNVCVMASIREPSKQMRIQHQCEHCVDKAQQETLSSLLTPAALSLSLDFLINSVWLCVFSCSESWAWSGQILYSNFQFNDFDFINDSWYIYVWAYVGHGLCMRAMFTAVSVNDKCKANSFSSCHLFTKIFLSLSLKAHIGVIYLSFLLDLWPFLTSTMYL